MTQPDQPRPPHQPYGGQGWQAPPPGQYGQPGPYGPPPGQYPQPPQGWAPGYDYGAPTPPPPTPKKRFGIGAKIGIGFLVLFFLAAIFNNRGGDSRTITDTAATPTITNRTQQGAAPTQSPPPPFTGARPGDLAGQPGATLVASPAAITATPLTDGDSTFGSTLCATVTYLNRAGDRTVRYGSYDWTMQNPAGAIVNITYFGGTANFLSNGELAPGGTVSGQVCFEDENASAGNYVLLYEAPSFFTNQRLAWINPR